VVHADRFRICSVELNVHVRSVRRPNRMVLVSINQIRRGLTLLAIITPEKVLTHLVVHVPGQGRVAQIVFVRFILQFLEFGWALNQILLLHLLLLAGISREASFLLTIVAVMLDYLGLGDEKVGVLIFIIGFILRRRFSFYFFTLHFVFILHL